MCKLTRTISESAADITAAIRSLTRAIKEFIVAVSPAVEAIASWGTGWRDVALAERAAKEAALAEVETLGGELSTANQALADFQADDAATDAQQLADAAAAADQAAQDRLAELKAGDPATGDNPTPDPEPEPPIDE